MKQHYGCEKNKFAEERFICNQPCGYIMSDKKCGKLTEIKEEQIENK